MEPDEEKLWALAAEMWDAEHYEEPEAIQQEEQQEGTPDIATITNAFSMRNWASYTRNCPCDNCPLRTDCATGKACRLYWKWLDKDDFNKAMNTQKWSQIGAEPTFEILFRAENANE